jgi:hypothetical protein
MRTPIKAPMRPRRPWGSVPSRSSQRWPHPVQARYLWLPRRSATTEAEPQWGHSPTHDRGGGPDPRLVLMAGQGRA